MFTLLTFFWNVQDDAPPLEDDETKEKRTDDISSWDADFLKVEQSTLFELILVQILNIYLILPSKSCVDNTQYIPIGSKLFGYQGLVGRDLQDRGKHDQGEDPR